MRIDHFLNRSALAALILLLPATAMSRCIPFDPGSVSAEEARILMIPGGSGPTLESLGATILIVVVVNECPGVPAVGIPAQDIWLSATGDGAVSFCAGSGIADHPTDANGSTTFTGVLSGGGWSSEGLQVKIGEQDFFAPVPIRVVSPDINADLVVDLGDIAEFAEDYLSGSYTARSDFNFDGQLDLSDFATLAIHVGDGCP